MEVMTRCRPIFNQEGNLRFVVGSSTNIRELNKLRVTLEKEKRQSTKYLREIEHLRKVLLLGEDVAFDSPEMKSLLEDVLKIAPYDYTVLITGESGVGKEVIAKTIHMNSARRNGPFIPVCIPAIPSSLLEAEIFGYEGGTFTGALRGGKVGLFEIAQGGTLFLDEMGDIPQEMQVKLLRAIETGEIRKVGGTRTIRLDARIIAATNRDLPQMIREGLFREDLYYRLSVVPIHVRPLRERPEDLQPLCTRFLQEINQKYGKNRSLSGEALDVLMRHSWPGNIRELKHVMERLFIMANGDLIIPDDVREVLKSVHPETAKRRMSRENALEKEYEAHERDRILKALKKAGGNKRKAAEILGMTRTKLYRKLNRYG
jgi:transcriptional regulator with PAS, ATPase and Fis domain